MFGSYCRTFLVVPPACQARRARSWGTGRVGKLIFASLRAKRQDFGLAMLHRGPGTSGPMKLSAKWYSTVHGTEHTPCLISLCCSSHIMKVLYFEGGLLLFRMEQNGMEPYWC